MNMLVKDVIVFTLANNRPELEIMCEEREKLLLLVQAEVHDSSGT